ncbi:hypothetical protein QUQ62_000101 [Escherichia coli]|nr:hypothetical protein [Escherichia coli]
MQKYMLEVLLADSNRWERYGLFDREDSAHNEGVLIVNSFWKALDFMVTPIQIPDKVEGMKYDIDNGACFKENLADSMDQSCREIHAHGFPADDPKAKREYEKAAKDFCIDNLSAFDK